MKILIGPGTCEVTFGESDKDYVGRTLFLYGEGNCKNEFFVSKALLNKMWWSIPNNDSTSSTSTWVDDNTKEQLLNYVICEAKKIGYNIALW